MADVLKDVTSFCRSVTLGLTRDKKKINQDKEG